MPWSLVGLNNTRLPLERSLHIREPARWQYDCIESLVSIFTGGRRAPHLSVFWRPNGDSAKDPVISLQRKRVMNKAVAPRGLFVAREVASLSLDEALQRCALYLRGGGERGPCVHGITASALLSRLPEAETEKEARKILEVSFARTLHGDEDERSGVGGSVPTGLVGNVNSRQA